MPVTQTAPRFPFGQLLGPEWWSPGTAGDVSLSMSARPIPARLVQQIRAGRYVDMRDLLWDNVAVRRHFEDIQGGMGVHLLPISSRPRVRDVPTLASWVCCFLSYLAVQISDPSTRDRVTYAMLVVREAMRHGGQGWLDYDRLFRQQAALNPNLPWNVIHPELQATTILGQRPPGAGSFCTLCQECDHTVQQCALTQLQQPALRSAPTSLRASGRSLGRICSSWNDGACLYPGACNYRHICSNCFQHSHPAKDCRLPPRQRPSGGPARPTAYMPRSSS